MSIVTPQSMRACYDLLRIVVFQNDKMLPDSRYVRFIARRYKHHGYHDYMKGRHTIWADTTRKDTPSITKLMQIMCHEMIHIIRRDHKPEIPDEVAHDTFFKELCAVAESIMGWPKGSV
jgi:hypothetical protein